MTFILDDILLAPCTLITWVGQKLYDQAVAEITDESVIHERLLDLQIRLDLEQIDEDEFVKQENVLMWRLNEIRKYEEAREKRQ